MADRASQYQYINSATTTQVKSGRGRLRRIVFNKPIASSTVTIYDETSGTSKVIGLITNTSDVKPYFLDFNIIFGTGLKIVTSAADFITVVYE